MLRLFETKRKDGSAGYIQIGITLMQGEDGETRYLMATSDSTELLRLNKELEQSNKDLQKANDELQARITEIKDLKRNQNHLLHVISHELNSPLHVTTSLLELLNDKETTQRERAEFSQELSSQIDYVITAIRLLIDYADLQDNRFHLVAEPVIVKNWLRTSINSVFNTHPTSNTRLSVHCQFPDDLTIIADHRRLQSILTGLVSNSLTHAKANRIDVYVAAERQTNPPILSIFVSDDGKGIEKQILDKMFEPLANIDQRQELGAGGLGIGLSMYRAYIDSMGGTIEVKSSINGTGTQIGLKIPVKLYQSDFNAVIPAIEHDEKPLYGIHIMLVDDDKRIQKIVGLRLKRLGAAVTVASNGQEAVNIANSHQEFPFDLILMDLDMPVMNGFDATKEIRLIEDYENIPIFAVTAAVESDAFPKAIAAGMNGCYGKPFDPALLVSILAKRLSSDQ